MQAASAKTMLAAGCGSPMIAVEAENLSSAQSYKLISGAVVPRPIAWVSSLNAEGKVNLAPFSSFTFLTYDPPMIAVSIGPGTEELKDTLANVQARGEFVVNAVDVDMVRSMADSSRRYPPALSEAEDLGIALAPSCKVAAPRVAAAPLALECRAERIIDMNDRDAHRLVIGRVVVFQVAEAIWTGDRIDPFKYAPVGRIGGPLYVVPGEILRVEVSKDDQAS
jgi:flavin reductase (DIM6/NTAB) family NADH-FMN oxidoreductase RutF